MKLGDLFDLEDLEDEIAAGHIHRRRHPNLPLEIHTYSSACQAARRWNHVTIRCRGLVSHTVTGEIAGWCMPKFHTYAEHQAGLPHAGPLPDEPFTVTEKIDGALVIVFCHELELVVATRGSFTSPVAHWASGWLDRHDTSRLQPGVTYLAEAICPASRIVVDYGTRQDLTLITAYTRNGQELTPERAARDWAGVGGTVPTWPAIRRHDVVARAASLSLRLDGTISTGRNAEGYVLRFASGLRVKVKLAAYEDLHRRVTRTSERTIWRIVGMQTLSGNVPAGKLASVLGGNPDHTLPASLDALVDGAPDEFRAWATRVAQSLANQARALRHEWALAHTRLATQRPATQREFADLARAQVPDKTTRAAVLLLAAGRSTGLLAWRQVRPAAARPFIAAGDGGGDD